MSSKGSAFFPRFADTFLSFLLRFHQNHWEEGCVALYRRESCSSFHLHVRCSSTSLYARRTRADLRRVRIRQPSLVHPFHLPPPLLPHFSTEKGVVSPNPPPPPTQQDGFRTTVAEAEFRQSMFGKKSRVVVKVRFFVFKCVDNRFS